MRGDWEGLHLFLVVAAVALVSFGVAAGLSLYLLEANLLPLQYGNHDRIEIASDAEFTAANGVTAGRGTASDPFVISGWDVRPSRDPTLIYPGIYIRNTDVRFAIRDVYVHDFRFGIIFDNVSYGAIEGSVVADNELRGVWIADSTNVSVQGNTLTMTAEGVTVYNSSTVMVAENRIERNDAGGISISASSAIGVTGNDVSINRVGIRLLNSTNVTVHYNNLVNNSLQAYDDTVTYNRWDLGYPDGGSYWSGDAGVDRCRGPEQDDCTAPDSLLDTPHLIATGNASKTGARDTYPLSARAIIPPTPADPRPVHKLVSNVFGLAAAGTSELFLYADRRRKHPKSRADASRHPDAKTADLVGRQVRIEIDASVPAARRRRVLAGFILRTLLDRRWTGTPHHIAVLELERRWASLGRGRGLVSIKAGEPDQDIAALLSLPWLNVDIYGEPAWIAECDENDPRYIAGGESVYLGFGIASLHKERS